MSRDIILAHPWQGHGVNERVTLDDDRARQIVQAGAARYAEDAPVAPLPVPEDAEPPVTAPRSARGSAVRGDSASSPATGTVTAE